MIIILPTGTGFIVGTLPGKNKDHKTPVQKTNPRPSAFQPFAKYFKGVRRWMRHSTLSH